MPGLIECVPNFSEGRREEVVEEIVHAIGQIEGVSVLDHTRDETHNRSVVTFAGSAEPVVRAATAAVGRALELIDMEQHAGAHPRIGAVDVMPFVPLGTTRLEECVDLARRFGEQIATRFELPVYLYGAAALRPERRRLADVRRGQYEALRDEIASDPDRAPDFGPARLHPRGGAIAVGARKPLIAFNINLRTAELATAIKIATAIRESSGGMPAVQAMGVLLENPGKPTMAQVSMNLVDWERTGIAREAGATVHPDDEISVERRLLRQPRCRDRRAVAFVDEPGFDGVRIRFRHTDRQQAGSSAELLEGNPRPRVDPEARLNRDVLPAIDGIRHRDADDA